MPKEIAAELLSDKFLKTAEDWDAAGRLVARGFADEMAKLGEDFSFSAPEGDEEEEEETEAEEAAEEAEEGEISLEDLTTLVQALGL